MKLRIVLAAIYLGLFFFSNDVLAGNYVTKNGYEVELNWKVKHRRLLEIWGAVKESKRCKNLKLHIGMKHNDGWYRNFYKTYNQPSSSSRLPFVLEKEHHSKTLPSKGWYPARINVTCDDSFYKKS